MSTRETKKVILPYTKKEVDIYTYITGGEKRKITEILTEGIKADLNGKAQGDIALSVVYKANDMTLTLLVPSMKIEEINDLPVTDYDFLLAQVNDITKDVAYSEKKTS